METVALSQARMRRRLCVGRGVSVVSLLLLASALAANAAQPPPPPPPCFRTSNYFRTHFNDTSNVLDKPASSAQLQVCGKLQESCCGENSEPQLVTVGRNMYEEKLQTSLKGLSVMYKEKAAKFDEYFRDMLNKARMGFHDMFKKTYGMMYEQNSYLFQDLFRDLEKYYDSGNSNIIEVLENFFSVLCQKMFTVMNSQYTFDSKYLVCVSESMAEVAPFGDVPDKLSAPLKRSFVASRTYVQALKIAGDILANINKMMPTQECLLGFTRMTQCPACKDTEFFQDSRACNGYCLNVMKGCLAYHSQLDQDWNAFLDIMEKVRKRLLGPFNIELVVIPINVKISEGIMNFQENAQKVSQKVFSSCGKPTLGPSRRRKRSEMYGGDYYDEQQGRVMNDGNKDQNQDQDQDDDDDDDDDEDDEDEYEEIKPPVATRKNNDKRGGGGNASGENGGDRKNQQRKNKNNSGPKNGGGGGNNKGRKKNKNNRLEGEDEDQGTPAYAFHRLLKDIGNDVESKKTFWKRLPYEVCNEISVNSQNATCWNGSALSSYTKEVMRDGIKNQRKNPEVPVDLLRPSSLLNEQVFALKALTNLLKNAYQGLDVEWDMEEVFHGGESSGIGPIASSGDGSGEEDAEAPATVVVDPASPTSTTTTTAVATSTVRSVDNNEIDSGTGNTDSSAGHKVKVSLRKALATYMLPVVAVWFGGSFLEWIL
ncbi:glypican-6-like [Adelges cooleyi]|uniref:glypican-6-like n=1 Tax=Adelges cooleyi TaxID=133065 RepID=UPI00217F8EF9|nr:glypican-6-like [Adelges cooleyi]